jgi:hypothetical protein
MELPEHETEWDWKGSNDRGDSILDEGDTFKADYLKGYGKQQGSHRNNKSLSKITKYSCTIERGPGAY